MDGFRCEPCTETRICRTGHAARVTFTLLVGLCLSPDAM